MNCQKIRPNRVSVGTRSDMPRSITGPSRPGPYCHESAVILLGWRAEPFRRRSAHARSGTSHIAQDQSTDSRRRDRQGYGPVPGNL